MNHEPQPVSAHTRPNGDGVEVDRLPVPGGWLYRTFVTSGKYATPPMATIAVSQEFVPDDEGNADHYYGANSLRRAKAGMIDLDKEGNGG